VENFLSIRRVDLRLQSLNVLVGPNGAGKTNLLKVFQFLGEVARRELAPAISAIGGFDNLLYRGEERAASNVRIELQGVVTKHSSFSALDEYKLSFWRVGRRRVAESPIISEMFQRVENLVFKRTQGRGRRITLKGGKATVGNTGEAVQGPEQTIEIQDSATGLGTLRRLSTEYGSPEWNAFAEVVEQLRLFEIDVDKVRLPSTLSDNNVLRPDASNLAAFLLYLQASHPESFAAVCEDVGFVLPGFRGFNFVAVGGSEAAVRLDIEEDHLRGATPLARASYGTIRAIALFAMLHDPAPPKLTCLEEVDHGLHPHALDRVVERLRQAADHTQIILATHSPALVNRFEAAELIIVERDAATGSSRFGRPDRSLVASLQARTDYQLGELWFSGVLGGGLE
jgi:predicted ATPase